MGLATARRLLDKGARVVIAGRDKALLDAAVEELARGGRMLAVPGDARISLTSMSWWLRS